MNDSKDKRLILLTGIATLIAISVWLYLITPYNLQPLWLFIIENGIDHNISAKSIIVLIVIVLISLGISVLVYLVLNTLISSRRKAVDFADNALKSLSYDKARTKAALESIGDGVISIEKDGAINSVNKSFENMMGWDSLELRGKKFTKAIPTLDKDGKTTTDGARLYSKALKNKINSSTTINDSLYYKRKDGTLFPVAITISPIILHDEVIGVVETFRDITKEAEVNKAKTELVSLASHQLRTPLSTINWYTEMLLSGDAGKIKEEQREFLNEIYGGTQKMTALVNALLNVSRLELGTFIVEPKPTNVVTLAKDIIKEQDPQIKTKNIEIEEIFPENIADINVDPKLITIIFQNLISNAVKYTPTNGKVEVEIKLNKKDLNIRVSDNGWGIPEAEKDKVFSKLFRATNAKAHEVEGTGLGLYIIKSIVEHSNGKLSFESKENEGTTFRITLPIEGMKKKDGEMPLS